MRVAFAALFAFRSARTQVYACGAQAAQIAAASCLLGGYL
jgi:hypothetical protein